MLQTLRMESSTIYDPATGTKTVYYPLDIFEYRFMPLSREDEEKGAITKLSIIVLGAKLANRLEPVRVDNILFIPRTPFPLTLEEFEDVEIIYPDLSGKIDEIQMERFEHRVSTLYHYEYLWDKEVRKRILTPDNDIIF